MHSSVAECAVVLGNCTMKKGPDHTGPFLFSTFYMWCLTSENILCANYALIILFTSSVYAKKSLTYVSYCEMHENRGILEHTFVAAY
jgi:hypothetical protein